MIKFLRKFFKLILNSTGFIAGIVAIIATVITLVSYLSNQDYIEMGRVAAFLSYLFDFLWIRVFILVVVGWLVKYSFGFLMVYLVSLEGDYRFTKLTTMVGVAMGSAGISFFNIQWLILGKPKETFAYIFPYVLIALALYILAVTVVYDHYKKTVGIKRSSKKPERSSRKKELGFILMARWISVRFPIKNLNILFGTQFAAYLLMGFVFFR